MTLNITATAAFTGTVGGSGGVPCDLESRFSARVSISILFEIGKDEVREYMDKLNILNMQCGLQ
ncbi:hypothetical protein L915_07931 [Phytophthora nicotianae]|uniref:Uncharacterized protein n=1 Tax=Phytophthora nicotianae TaxID=4792 RepID=W2GXB8_PHYNI|nr:hypothetical protein L915_07931 [Phytophthora nicotianae]ETL41089.1 hypothetical protein L916_07859 [Phytophthora nicotianae]